MNYIHHNNVVHRDLKADNIGVAYKTPIEFKNIEVKLLDFGFAKSYENSELNSLNDFIGTPYFIAPEIINNEKYGAKCDIWSLGVVTYSLISGKYPFEAHDRKELFELIKQAKVTFSEPIWNSISKEAKDFIKECLTLD